MLMTCSTAIKKSLSLIKPLFYICIAMGLVSQVSCSKISCSEPEAGYFFEIPATISPKQDTFRIGDTIYFVSEFNDMVKERETGQSYKLENFSFYPVTHIVRIDDKPTQGGLDNFEVIMDEAYNYNEERLSSGLVLLRGNYLYQESKYKLEFALVPQVSGLYRFSHNSWLMEDHGGEQNFEGRCENRPIREILVYVNKGDDNNIDLLRNSPDSYWNESIFIDPQRNFYEQGAYVFYVVD